MDEEGIHESRLLTELKERLRQDLAYDSGKIIGSMCTLPHKFASKIFRMTIEKNLGDSGIFLGTLRLETEVISMMGSLLSNHYAAGHIVSGGSEANILALWAARNSSKKTRPNVIIPRSSHASLYKAADLLGLKVVEVNVNRKFEVNSALVGKAVNDQTVAIVGVAGTTSLGTVDPIPELSEIALKRNVHLHVDAAFGGFVIPFLKELGYDKIPDFDFRLEGVRSITIDPHKMGLAPIPGGGILFRDKEDLDRIRFNQPYLAGGMGSIETITGTRPGASVVAVWGLLKHLGKAGYREVVRSCMENALSGYEEAKKLKGVSPMIKPVMNILGFQADHVKAEVVGERLRRKGYAVSVYPSHIRLVVMPHLERDHIISFLKELEASTKN